MKKSGLVALTTALVVLMSMPAEARGHPRGQPRNPGVTLGVAPNTVDYGRDVNVSGTIDPPAAGEHVVIKTTQGDTVASGDTDASGAFQASFVPDRNMTIHAEWGAESSPGADVGVRAVVEVKIEDVRLFGDALVTGTVAPPNGGAPVDIRLMVGSRKAASVQANMNPTGEFKVKIHIDEPGTYEAVATFEDASHLQGTATSAKRDTPLPNLHQGSHGIAVLLLERRLVELNYHLTGVNQAFDERTADAVLGFRKVQGMVRTSTVDVAAWRALADPKLPQAASNMTRFHIEVDLSKQVLYTVKAQKITNILHVSTGKPSTPTPPGKYHIMFKQPGMNSLGMFWSAYFLQHFAIHGYADVPNYAASHGCVRIPYWEAKWIYDLAKIRTPMWIYP